MLNKLKEVLKYLQEIESDVDDIGLQHEDVANEYSGLLNTIKMCIEYEIEARVYGYEES